MLTLKQGRVLDEWSTLIEGCHELGEDLLVSVDRNLVAAEAPGLKWGRESVAPGRLKALFGKRRDFLIVRSDRFFDYLVCIAARDYGKNLDVSWYLTGGRNLLKRLRKFNSQVNLDVFDQQDLRAYVTVAHHAVRKAVEDLMRERQLDVARLERRSRGLLAVA